MKKPLEKEAKKALFVQKQEKKLASFAQYEFPRTVSVKSGSYGSSSEAYAQGFSEGKKLRIREPLEKKPLKRIR